MATTFDDAGNAQVDFVWGNIPMQPDDERGMATLDPALDNHIIAATSYNGFPGYTPNAPFLDTIANTTVPDVIGMTESGATSALLGAGLVKGTVTTSADGATELNDGKIKAQSIEDGTLVNEGTAVNLVKFAYVAPGA